MVTVELQLESGRVTLQYLCKDICQIYNVGKSVIEKLDSNLISSCLTMYTYVSDLTSIYIDKFKSKVNLAILEGNKLLFPTEEDTQQRNEVNVLHYKIVEYH